LPLLIIPLSIAACAIITFGVLNFVDAGFVYGVTWGGLVAGPRILSRCCGPWKRPARRPGLGRVAGRGDGRPAGGLVAGS
jgi:hypothetical protein